MMRLNSKGEEGFITKPDSKIAALLVPTDEELMISRDIGSDQAPRTKNFKQKAFIIGILFLQILFLVRSIFKMVDISRKRYYRKCRKINKGDLAMTVDYSSKEYLNKLDAYWRAANYVSVGQLYLKR